MIAIMILVIAEQWYEALFEKGQKTKSKRIQTIWTACWFLLLPLGYLFNGKWYVLLLIPLAYILLRMSLADYVATQFRDLSWNYQCSTSGLWDRFINKIKPHKTLYIIWIVVCGGAGAYICWSFK